ncbi:rCG45937 [Rattus norvegicus]|uniref:RCG45937 n=1 Tax=Rattus norvegicus TaxID=10116 RepID=A6ICM5_RAT|nr:rCG45937 [Rattus norvegicus]
MGLAPFLIFCFPISISQMCEMKC